MVQAGAKICNSSEFSRHWLYGKYISKKFTMFHFLAPFICLTSELLLMQLSKIYVDIFVLLYVAFLHTFVLSIQHFQFYIPLLPEHGPGLCINPFVKCFADINFLLS